MLSIGLMSGTSMDGIDAALIETDGTPPCLQERGFFSMDYDPRFSLLLKATEYAVRQAQGNLQKTKEEFAQYLNQYWQQQGIKSEVIENYFPSSLPITFDQIERHSTELHLQSVKQLLQKLDIKKEEIAVVGYHGQTLLHHPQKKCSIMLGDPQYLAEQLGIKVVYDFRREDIERGGQGAPFAPLYHFALGVRDGCVPLAVVNCGGIANITIIASENEEEVLGFDTGPGNALIDSLVRLRTQGRCSMDRDGGYGKKGTIHENVLQALYDQSILKEGKNYFSLKPPKSLDYGDMKLISELDALSLEDACATLEAFTADTIVRSLKELAVIPTQFILAGGGWKNPVIREELVKRLHRKYGESIRVQTAEEVGWNAQALEAQIFAYFAVRSLHNMPLSVPGTTGVPYPLSGGKIYS